MLYMAENLTTRQQIKHALISILIGAIIAFITTLLQGLVQWLQHVDLQPTGAVGGVGYYLLKLIHNRPT